jgi:uncharacterized protein (TIGR02301 family)
MFRQKNDMGGRRILLVFMTAALLAATAPARAVDAPYDKDLMRLAELLGSLHYLRNLCGETQNTWREQMEALLGVEDPEPARRARFVASFNRGYRTFDSIYTTCTASAVEAIARYMREGETLTKEIAGKYGN